MALDLSSFHAKPAALDVGETAAVLNVHPNTVRRLVKAGKLPSVRIANTVRIPVDAVERALAEGVQ